MTTTLEKELANPIPGVITDPDRLLRVIEWIDPEQLELQFRGCPVIGERCGPDCAHMIAAVEGGSVVILCRVFERAAPLGYCDDGFDRDVIRELFIR